MIKNVRLVISQPRLNALTEWVVSVEDLRAFKAEALVKAQRQRELAKDYDDGLVKVEELPLTPGEKQCQWCKAKATCPAIEREIMGMFENLDAKEPTVEAEHLGKALKMVPMIEGWCKAVRARVEGDMLAGVPIPGFKLVEGRKGPRKWADDAEAEEMLKSFRLKTEEMYKLSLISPTTAEELAEQKVIGPRQYKRLVPLVTRTEASLSVAPESDKRPAVTLQDVTDDFENLDAESSVDDLL